MSKLLIISIFLLASQFAREVKTKPHPNNYEGPERRIVGGKLAKVHQFPYQVAIEQEGLDIVCSGSIYTESLIITAAHCFFDEKMGRVPIEQFTIHAGEHDFSKKEGGESVRKIKQVMINGDFFRNRVSDVALVEVERPFQLTNDIEKIKLADPDSKYEKTCTASGWGYTIPKKEHDDLKAAGFPDILRMVEVDIIDKETCIKLHAPNEFHFRTAKQYEILCAGNLNGGKDICAADSGGPLVCKDLKNGYPLLVGLVHGGNGCGQKNSPAFYVDVAKQLDWIHVKAESIG